MLTIISPISLFWLAALIIFAVVEAATVSLVSIWFAGGALAALIVSALDGPLQLQIALFLIVSILLLALLRPFVKRVAKPKNARLNADRHIGAAALVTEEINNLSETGAVKLDGVTWTARSETGEVIPAGSKIQVTRIAGVKLYVIPAAEPAEVS